MKPARFTRFWSSRRQVASHATVQSAASIGDRFDGRLSRLELVFMHTARAGAAPLRRLMDKLYGGALRVEYNSHPPQHHFEVDEIKYWVDSVSRLIPNSGRAFAANFHMQWHDVGYTRRPVRFITLVREPIARIAGEFLAFQREVTARGGGDAKTLEIAGDIVRFADAMSRNEYLVRFFSNTDLCDAITDAGAERARAALTRLDVVGLHERPQLFAQELLSLDVFTKDKFEDARAAFAAEMSQIFRGPGDELAAQLDAQTRRQLEARNLRDLSLYRWLASKHE
jgi:hypothetical protein